MTLLACPLCGKEVKSSGLHAHLNAAAAHGIGYPEATDLAKQIKAAIESGDEAALQTIRDEHANSISPGMAEPDQALHDQADTASPPPVAPEASEAILLPRREGSPGLGLPDHMWLE